MMMRWRWWILAAIMAVAPVRAQVINRNPAGLPGFSAKQSSAWTAGHVLTVDVGGNTATFAAAAAGSGDITDVWGCTTGNCNALTGASGDTLDAGSADAISPAVRSTTLPGTCTEGFAYHDTDSGGTEFYTCTAANTWTKHLAGVDIDTSAELRSLITDETGSGGAAVFATSPTLTTPTIGDFTNANHAHTGATSGGTLDAAAIAAGTLPLARGGTNASSWTAARCVRVNAGGTALEVAAADCGTTASAPTDAQYVTLATNGTLTDERVLTAGTAIDVSDAGAGSTVTVDFDSTELGTTTFGGGSSITWTYNASAGTDCAVAFTNGQVDFNNCSILQGGTAVVTTARTLTGGAGIAAIGNLSADRTISTDSTEANFVASGALTCGASTQGKVQVHTTPLQYCDNAGTPALQYAAYGNSSGESTAAANTSVALGTDVSGSLGVTNGGTGLTSLAQGDLLYGFAANTIAALTKNTSATRYLANTGTSNAPAWAQVDVTNGVTGALPIANGGSGQTGATAAFNALDPLTTKGDLIAHNGTDSIRVAVGTNGLPLVADSGSTPGVAWAAVGPSGGGTGLTSYTKGDLIAAASSSVLAALTVGANGTFLVADSGQTLGVKWRTLAGGSSTDNALARFDGTAGDTLQNSAWTLDDNGLLTATSTSTSTAVAFVDGEALTLTASPVSASSSFFRGAVVTAKSSAGSSSVLSLEGLEAVGDYASSTANGSTGVVYGVVATGKKSGTGALLTSYGVFASSGNTNASGTLTNSYGVYIGNSPTTGTITNDWALYTAGTEASHFGGALDVDGALTLDSTVTQAFTSTLTSGSAIGRTTAVTATPGAGSTALWYGDYVSVQATGSQILTGSSLTGVYASADSAVSSNSSSALAYGVLGNAIKSGTGNFGTTYGGYFQAGNSNATGTLSNSYGAYVADSYSSGTVTNDWALYTAGAEESRFGGAVQLATATTSAAAPAAGALKVSAYAPSSFTFPLPSLRTPNERPWRLVPDFMSSWATACTLPGIGATMDPAGIEHHNIGGGGYRGTTGVSHPTIATTNTLTSMVRTLFTSSASAGNSAGLYGAKGMVWRGNASGLGGFLFYARFGSTTAVAQQRAFVGLYNSTSAIGNSAPNSLLDTIYVGYESAGTTLNVCGNNNSGTAGCTDLGANFPVNSSAVYDVWLYAPPNGSRWDYFVERLDSSFTASGTESDSTDMPQSTVFLEPQVWLNNGSTASAVEMNLMRACVSSQF